MITHYKYIHFKEDSTLAGDRWLVKNNKSNFTLGEVTFYEPWNQYVFQANPNCVFNNECLRNIAQFLSDVNEK